MTAYAIVNCTQQVQHAEHAQTTSTEGRVQGWGLLVHSQPATAHDRNTCTRMGLGPAKGRVTLSVTLPSTVNTDQQHDRQPDTGLQSHWRQQLQLKAYTGQLPYDLQMQVPFTLPPARKAVITIAPSTYATTVLTKPGPKAGPLPAAQCRQCKHC
jgi:hypothetical protein